ncbi:MAG: glutaredoxin [Brotaphodocola sp.]
MKITMIGSHLCQDTLYAMMKLKDRGVELDFHNIATDFPSLKEFLKLRENDPMFDVVKARDGLGIPVFVLEDGTKTLDLEEVLNKLS